MERPAHHEEGSLLDGHAGQQRQL
eukprot:COSAG01_NODE_51091_length_357_cov_2.178295_1_plen_23_part_01